MGSIRKAKITPILFAPLRSLRLSFFFDARRRRPRKNRPAPLPSHTIRYIVGSSTIFIPVYGSSLAPAMADSRHKFTPPALQTQRLPHFRAEPPTALCLK